MGFIALIFTLFIEQGRPLGEDNPVHRATLGMADSVRAITDAGERRYGVLGWLIVVGCALLAVGLLDWLASMVHPLAVFVVHVAVLYLTIGFRQLSHAFNEVQVALAADDASGARTVLERWLGRVDVDVAIDQVARESSASAVCREAIAAALVASHRHLFGPLFWYIVLPGVTGPVLYRIAELLARRWSRPLIDGTALVDEPYGAFADIAFRVIDWLPVRLSSASFAIVGNFEDAVYCWRGAIASGTATDSRALLLASGGGALGLRVAEPVLEARWAEGGQGFEWQGAEPDAGALQSAVGLVWRSAVLWISLFAMLTIATWLGR